MPAEFWKWLFGVIASSGLMGAIAFFMRESLSKFLAKTIELRFDKKIEKFKAEMRDNEAELAEIRSFLVSSRRERDSALQAKRLEAAETLLRARFQLSKLSMLVEYMKILNAENILKKGDDPKVAEFIKGLLEPFDIDASFKMIGSVDMTAPRLYLGEQPLKFFDAYQQIIFSAAMMMKLFTFPVGNKQDLFKAGHLRDLVVEIIPSTKESFEKFGEGFAYHWATYFHDEILRALRHEISGVDDMARDNASIQKLTIDSRQAQISARASLSKAGLSEELLKSPDAGDVKAFASAAKRD